MAKKSMILRDTKRMHIVEKFAAKRKELKQASVNVNLDEQVRQKAMEDLQKLPRNASPSRVRHRCQLTGRPRGYYRRFGLSRSKLRELIMQGQVPGAHKASW